MLFWPELKKCLLAIIIIFPIYITTTVVNGLVRVFIAIYFKFTKYSFAPSLDNVLQILSLNSTIVTVLYTDQGSTKVDMVQEKEFVQTSILNKLDGNGDKINKKLRYVWCKKFGYGCWMDTGKDFDINHHIREIKSNSGKYLTESQFLKDIVNPLTQPMPLGVRPQWEWIVVQNIEMPTGLSTARIFRCHHSIMDGVSIGLLLVNCVLTFPKELLGNNSSPFVVDPFKQLSLWTRFLKTLHILMAPFLLPWMLTEGILNNTLPEEDPFNTKAIYSGRTHIAQSPLLEASILRNIKDSSGTRIPVPTIMATLFKKAVHKWLPGSERGRSGYLIKLEIPTANLPVTSCAPQNAFLSSDMTFIAKEDPVLAKPLELGMRLWISRWFCEWGAKFPIWITTPLILDEDFTVTTALTNVPFTRIQGFLKRDRVTGLTAFVGLTKPLTLFVAVTRYGSVFRFSGQVEDSVMTEQELQNFLNTMADGVEELVKSSKKQHKD